MRTAELQIVQVLELTVPKMFGGRTPLKKAIYKVLESRTLPKNEKEDSLDTEMEIFGSSFDHFDRIL